MFVILIALLFFLYFLLKIRVKVTFLVFNILTAISISEEGIGIRLEL